MSHEEYVAVSRRLFARSLWERLDEASRTRTY